MVSCRCVLFFFLLISFRFRWYTKCICFATGQIIAHHYSFKQFIKVKGTVSFLNLTICNQKIGIGSNSINRFSENNGSPDKYFSFGWFSFVVFHLYSVIIIDPSILFVHMATDYNQKRRIVWFVSISLVGNTTSSTTTTATRNTDRNFTKLQPKSTKKKML